MYDCKDAQGVRAPKAGALGDAGVVAEDEEISMQAGKLC
jgi:hypothetical protein